MVSASAGFYAHQTGVYLQNEEEFEGAASSDMTSSENITENLFSELMLSNRVVLVSSLIPL